MANDFTYRADHIGPLIAPVALLEARQRHACGEIDAAALGEAENAAIKSAVQMQRSVGIAVTTDGGFRRADFAAAVLDGNALATTEAAPLKALSRGPIKVAVPAARPAPGEPFEGALARAGIVRKEIEALIAAGVDYIQLDTPGYAARLDEGGRALDDLMQLDATALSGIQRPANVRIAVHFAQPDDATLWPSFGEQGLAERLFHGLPADRFILPLDGTRTPALEPLGLVPKGRLVVLGLVSASTPALEDVDELMSRIDQAAKLIDGDDLALSTAGGFAGAANPGGPMSEADQRRKLELIADVATRWWGFAI